MYTWKGEKNCVINSGPTCVAGKGEKNLVINSGPSCVHVERRKELCH